MDKLPRKQQDLILELLSGNSIREAAEAAGVSYPWARELHSNKNPSKTQAFCDAYQAERVKQSERISQGIVDDAVAKVSEVDRSKEALLAELEEIAELCKMGETRYTKDGQSYLVQDPTNWIRTVVERGKLLGYYVEKTEDLTPVKKRKRDLSKLNRSQLKAYLELESIVATEAE